MKLMNRFYSLLALLFVGSASLQAQSDPFPDNSTVEYKYQGSMISVSQVVMNGVVVTDAVVAVYCEDDFRGKNRIGEDPDNSNLVFLYIHGDYTANKQYLHFKVFTQGKVFTCNPGPAFTFTFNGNVGLPSDPYIIDITPVSLANDGDNTTTLTTWENKTCDIVLTGRTFFKDGNWNTLCLPFPLSEKQIATTDLTGSTIMELDATGTYADDKGDHKTGFDAASGTLYLYFKSATSIEAGKPYIVKWGNTEGTEPTEDTELKNPVFPGVTVTSTPAGTVEAKNSGLNTVQFIGTYSPAPLTPNNKSNLFLGAGSTLYYPNDANNADGKYYVNSCRAYFHVDLDGQANVRAFVLNFGDEDTLGILTITADDRASSPNRTGIYTLDGQKIGTASDVSDSENLKALQPGLYIVNGKKVVIK